MLKTNSFCFFIIEQISFVMFITMTANDSWYYFYLCGKQSRYFRCQLRILYQFLDCGQYFFAAIFHFFHLFPYQLSIDLGKPFLQIRRTIRRLAKINHPKIPYKSCTCWIDIDEVLPEFRVPQNALLIILHFILCEFYSGIIFFFNHFNSWHISFP